MLWLSQTSWTGSLWSPHGLDKKVLSVKVNVST